MVPPRSTVGHADEPEKAGHTNQNSSSDEEYIVPVDVAPECLRMLLDTSGFTSPRNCYQQTSYTTLSSKILVETLQKIFKYESNRRKKGKECKNCMQMDHVDVLTGEQVQDLKSKADIIYTDLLPNHLGSSFRHERLFATIPMIKFESSRKPSVTRNVNIRKPDRNKKNRNFAQLCILFQLTGKNGTCGAVLRKYAKGGLSSAGYIR